MRYLIGDTETSGLQPPAAGIVDIAWLEVDPHTLEILEECDQLIDPEHPIPPRATEVHNITDEMVQDQPTLAEFKSEVLGLDYPFDEPICLIAHNVRFDRKFHCQVFNNIAQEYCTLAMARRMWPNGLPALNDGGKPNHKLGTIAAFLQIELGVAHRAMGDVKTLYNIIRKVCETTGQTLAQLTVPMMREVYVMPFGKWQGTKLVDIPKEYREWAILNMDLDADLKRSLLNLQAMP